MPRGAASGVPDTCIMRRMRSRPLLILATCFTSVAAFAQVSQARPKLAVLGLEVTGESAMDPKSTEAAKALTRELRREANRPSGAFELAPNSNKDLLEVKLLSNCSDEGRRCMSEIGKQLKAERLLYGKLEKKKVGYSVSLRLLDTETTEVVKQLTELIPFNDITVIGLQRRARSLYGRLTGAEEAGSLAITASAERGTVYVDGKIRTSLSAGSARVSGLTSGVHAVAIESSGFERFEAEVSIESGETRNLTATLVEVGGGDGGGVVGGGAGERPGRGWRIAFWSGVIAAGVAGAGWTYSGLTVRSEEKKKDEAYGLFSRQTDVPGYDDNKGFADVCDAFSAKADEDWAASDRKHYEDVRDACDAGRRHQKLVNWVWIPATAASVLFAGFAYYKGYVAADGATYERAARKRKRSPGRTRVTVSPALGPNLIGAGLELQF
jgi:hypothetical protein